jgi:Ca-activated chloride channel family protein
MLQFQNIQFLLELLVLIPLAALFVLVIKWKSKVRKALGDQRLIDQLTKNYSHKKYKLKVIAVLCAIALVIIAAANLRKPAKSRGSVANGVDVVIALDVSRSMLSQDEKPTRLDKAKQLIYQLTQQLQGNRMGLVVFAGDAYLQMPLTTDISATKMFVSNASPNLVPVQGTNISNALSVSDASLDIKEKKYKAVILITDGEDHEDKAVETAQQLADHGVVVHTVGVGSAEGVPIMEPGTEEYKKDENGQTVISKLNENLLHQIAAATNGTYHLLTNTADVVNGLSAELNRMEKKTINDFGGYVEYTSYYPAFLIAAILLLTAEALISERKGLKALRA